MKWKVWLIFLLFPLALPGAADEPPALPGARVDIFLLFLLAFMAGGVFQYWLHRLLVEEAFRKDIAQRVLAQLREQAAQELADRREMMEEADRIPEYCEEYDRAARESLPTASGK